MDMMHRIFDGFMKVGIIALIVVFQPEIRKFLLMIGSTNIRGKSILGKMKFLKSEISSDTDVESIIMACKNMSDSKTGALIVLERNNNLDFLLETGDHKH